MHNWQKIGKDAYQLASTRGFYHVMHVGGGVWSVTLNGRVIGSAGSANEGKALVS
ncbi:hypothetical protein [Mycolicibacterium sp.]|uniref:hypothetical protein n=1 Tax=Mycolicibacterium sp. TaxID=2320850 RepID=UPI00355F261A